MRGDEEECKELDVDDNVGDEEKFCFFVGGGDVNDSSFGVFMLSELLTKEEEDTVTA